MAVGYVIGNAVVVVIGVVYRVFGVGVDVSVAGDDVVCIGVGAVGIDVVGDGVADVDVRGVADCYAVVHCVYT